jgi:uncharacterized spore protein YtfJ
MSDEYTFFYRAQKTNLIEKIGRVFPHIIIKEKQMSRKRNEQQS